MAMTPEKKVKEKVKALCKRYGAYYAMPVMQGMANNGTPDILVGHAGHFAGVEVKAGSNKPTKLQLARLLEIRRAGCTALVINERNLGLLERWLAAPRWTLDNLNEYLPAEQKNPGPT